MSKKAILYTRVSTDEQADRGYSLRDQEDQLRKYCAHKQIEILAHFQDDHSAKTFDRPGFNKLLEFLKVNKRAADLLLFMKWDRFSRNAGDSYSMINKLNGFKVEVQAVEQPLDLNIPENKMMLAFYLAAPEVENDRRSLNVTNGMRRAKKEGRWVACAPKGYSNKRDEYNRPVIVPNDDATFIKEAFEQVALGIYTQEEVRKKLLLKGFNCGRNRFSVLLRDPVYAGKIRVPAYRNEVEGIHEAIIDEGLFFRVQDVLKNRRPKFPSVYKRQERFPLRGHLICNRCGIKLTASASHGNGGKYYYYHCQKGCRERHQADRLNAEFVSLLEGIKVEKGISRLYYHIIKDELKVNEQAKAVKVGKIDAQIKSEEKRIFNLQDMLADRGISATEFSEMKARYQSSISDLVKEKARISSMDSMYLKYMDYAFPLVENIALHYKEADLIAKQQLVSSIFPENLTFSDNHYQTDRVNRVVTLLSADNKDLLQSQQERNLKKADRSFMVTPAGFKPATLRAEI